MKDYLLASIPNVREKGKTMRSRAAECQWKLCVRGHQRSVTDTARKHKRGKHCNCLRCAAIFWRRCKVKNQYFYIITPRSLTTTPCGQPRSRLMTLVSSCSILYHSNSLVSTPSFSRAEDIKTFHSTCKTPWCHNTSLAGTHPPKVCPMAAFKCGLPLRKKCQSVSSLTTSCPAVASSDGLQ